MSARFAGRKENRRLTPASLSLLGASALLAIDTDPNGDALTLTGASGGVNGTASFNAKNNTVTSSA